MHRIDELLVGYVAGLYAEKMIGSSCVSAEKQRETEFKRATGHSDIFFLLRAS